MENQLKKILEKCLDKDDNLSKYNAIKNELDPIYDHITEVIRIRSKCEWYENKKKINKILFEFRKTKRSSKHNKRVDILKYELNAKLICLYNVCFQNRENLTTRREIIRLSAQIKGVY